MLVAAEDEDIDQAATDLRRDGRNQIHAVRADLATSEGVEELYRAIRDTGRPVDAIAINAGRGVGGDTPVGTASKDDPAVVAKQGFEAHRSSLKVSMR